MAEQTDRTFSHWSDWERETLLRKVFELEGEETLWLDVVELLPGRTVEACRTHYYRLTSAPVLDEKQVLAFTLEYMTHGDKVWESIIKLQGLQKPWEKLGADWKLLERSHWYMTFRKTMWHDIATRMRLPPPIVERIFWGLPEYARCPGPDGPLPLEKNLP